MLTDYFQLWILYKIDLRISTAEEHMGNLRFKLLNKKNGSIFQIIDHIKVSRVLL